MKILVFAHQLEVGGTQVNAIELASALRDLHGHEVSIFASPGPMVKLIRDRGLRFHAAPEPHLYPSIARMRALRQVVRRERPDIVHAWDWWQCLDAYYGVHLPWRVPLLVSDMCMSISRLLPRSVPTTFGTPEVVDRARASGRRRVDLLLPPVDVRSNAPGTADPAIFRERFGIAEAELLAVTVSRFDQSLKAESLLRTIDAVRTLGRTLPLRLVLVGDGALRSVLQRLANEANDELGRHVISLAGGLIDPRIAYASADFVIGMGGSALRSMAFAKPVIVVGANGFAARFTHETASSFYYTGMYGIGDGDEGNSRLAQEIRALADRPGDLPLLGAFSRAFVLEHFALDTAAARLSAFCEAARREQSPLRTAIVDGVRTALVWLRERRFRRATRAFVATPQDAIPRPDQEVRGTY